MRPSRSSSASVPMGDAPTPTPTPPLAALLSWTGWWLHWCVEPCIKQQSQHAEIRLFHTEMWSCSVWQAGNFPLPHPCGHVHAHLRKCHYFNEWFHSRLLLWNSSGACTLIGSSIEVESERTCGYCKTSFAWEHLPAATSKAAVTNYVRKADNKAKNTLRIVSRKQKRKNEAS